MSNIKETLDDLTNTLNTINDLENDIKEPITPVLLSDKKELISNTIINIKDDIVDDIKSSIIKNTDDIVEQGVKKVENELNKTNIGTGVNAVMKYLTSQKEKINNIVNNSSDSHVSSHVELTPNNNKENSNSLTPNKFKTSLSEKQNGIQRIRKVDRKNLFSELCSELPITLKYTEGNLDGNDTVLNYAQEWKQWYEVDERDELKELIDELKRLEEKYKILGKFNTNIDKGIQFSLLVLGSGVVYVEASKASTEVISKWNIVAGALTTTATIVYNFFKFDKKGPHYNTISNNIRKLRSWIEGKMILPIDKRYSPFDIYSISFKAYQSIIEEAQSINNTK